MCLLERLYMGIYKEPRTRMYWNTDFNQGPLHTIANHYSLRCFGQNKRYCPISRPERDQKRGISGRYKIWWYKIEPLASALQASFQRIYSPSSEVSIDELMLRCFGK
jgi:hypothetical protein